MDDKTRKRIVKASLELCGNGYGVDETVKIVKFFYPEHAAVEELVARSAIEMYESLLSAIDLAGGSIPCSDLFNWSLIDLIEHLCTNNVRFYYKEFPTKRREKKNE